MKGKNLLIAGSIIGAIIVLLGIGTLISPNPTNANNSTVISNSTNTEEDFYFDNSTPEATAISIARLNDGEFSFDSNIKVNNASLTADGKYWVVNMHAEGHADWNVTVDAETLMSKKDGGPYTPLNTWRSLDELKAAYIAELQAKIGVVEKPYKLTMNGKEIWKVPVYELFPDRELVGYIYVDLATGKSKDSTTEEGWMTLKEVDDSITKIDRRPVPFKDALRDLYPE